MRNIKRKINRTILPLIVLIALSGFAMACERKAPVDGKAGTVRVAIITGETTQNHTTEVPASSTVLDAMQNLQTSGALTFGMQGAGTEAMIDAINGTRNGEDGPYWIYAVNGKLADRGVGLLSANGGDQIRWCYLSYEERETCAQTTDTAN